MNYFKDTLEYLSKFFTWWVIIQPWEQGIRTRFGKNTKFLMKGMYLRIPFFDTVYIQTVRLRIISMPVQTVSTKNGQTISICSSIGYSISNIEKLYNSLYNPEGTISNIIMSEISEYVYLRDLNDCSPKEIENSVILKLQNSDFGIKYEYVKILSYAVVKTYRLIQDMHWTPDLLTLEKKE